LVDGRRERKGSAAASIMSITVTSPVAREVSGEIGDDTGT